MLTSDGDEDVPPILHDAAGSGDSSVVRRQLRGGADVHQKWDTETALHVSCRRGHSDIVELLLKAGADYRVLTDYRRETTLFLAAKFGHLAVVKVNHMSYPKHVNSGVRMNSSRPFVENTLRATGTALPSQHRNLGHSKHTFYYKKMHIFTHF